MAALTWKRWTNAAPTGESLLLSSTKTLTACNPVQWKAQQPGAANQARQQLRLGQRVHPQRKQGMPWCGRKQQHGGRPRSLYNGWAACWYNGKSTTSVSHHHNIAPPARARGYKDRVSIREKYGQGPVAGAGPCPLQHASTYLAL